MERERAAIIELFSNGKCTGEILKLLHIPNSRRKVVYRIIQRYNKTGDIRDMPRSGRPKSVTTPRLKKIVMDRKGEILDDLFGKWPLSSNFIGIYAKPREERFAPQIF